MSLRQRILDKTNLLKYPVLVTSLLILISSSVLLYSYLNHRILLSFITFGFLLAMTIAIIHLSLSGLQAALVQARENAQELDEMNKNLEQLVNLRTLALSDKNQELQQAIDQLKQAQDTIVMQDKMASLGQLTAGIAHEIKNPLNFIKNFSEVSIELIDELQPKVTAIDANQELSCAQIISDLRLNATKVHEHTLRVDSIIRSMLLHSRSSSSVQQSVKLKEFLVQSFNLAMAGFKSQNNTVNITLNWRVDASMKITLYPNEFARVLLNLFSNALYEVTRRAKEEIINYTPAIDVAAHVDGQFIHIKIKDNGYGIKPEDINHIFEPFYTTKPTSIGTGLGLSLSFDLITNLHQGKLSVDSEFGSYAEFIVSLPLA